MYREKGNHIVTTAIEQRATLDVCKRLERQGFEVTYLPVGREGLVDLEAIRAAHHRQDHPDLDHVRQQRDRHHPADRARSASSPRRRAIIFHTDATQAVGKIPVDVEAMGIDLLSMTAHMIYGPKGVGALYVRRKSPRVRLAPMMDGGGHERGMRSGTVPVPLVVGFGKAAEICREVMARGVASAWPRCATGCRSRSSPRWTRPTSTAIRSGGCPTT